VTPVTPPETETGADSEAVRFGYADAALKVVEDGTGLPFWRHMHWGLFPDPEVDDPGPERYFRAAEAMTEHMVAIAAVRDGRRVLDVGCGFGGTLDHVRRHRQGCRLVGVNIDRQQLLAARGLLGIGNGTAPAGGHAAGGHAAGDGGPPVLVTADGCRLPVADASVDHVLAVECIFHFPSRRDFFREAARVLAPEGTLAVSDLLVAPGQLASVVTRMGQEQLGDANWYGHLSKPLTAAGYERLARRTGFELVADDDVTAATMPTYPALRHLAALAGGTGGLTTAGGIEDLSLTGALQYHALGFRRR
jgi:SAM-dependent methyltransferase